MPERITDGEAERREDIATMRTKTFWQKIPHKGDVCIKDDVMRVFPLARGALRPLEHKHEILSALPDATGSAHAAAPRDHSAAVPEWAEMTESQKACYFMNPKDCKFLEEKKRKRKRKHAAMKAALESCGEEIPDRKRYKHSFAPCTQSDGEDSDDDI